MIALAAGAAPVHAQPVVTTTEAGAAGPAVARPAAVRFSLADALTLARRDHPSLRAAAGRRLSAVGAARQDAAFFNPVVEWRRENIGAPIPRDEFVTATLGADAYGRRYALRGLVGSVAARAAADSTVTGRAVEFDVARAYWRAALAIALRDVADAQRRAVDSLSAVQARRAREGAVAEGAAMRTALEADRVRLTAATARADAERARGDLARALAQPLDVVPWPTDSLEPGARARVAVAGVGGPDPRTSQARLVAAVASTEVTPATSAPDPRAYAAAALRGRPEILAARARLAETERRVRAERLGGLPGVGAVSGYKGTGGYRTGVLGVFVSVPLFDRNQGARARAAGDLLAAQNDLRAQEAQITAEVEASVRAYAALLAEGPTGGGVAAALDARGRDVADVTAVAYREGAATLLELLDAVRSRGDVRAAAVRWAADLRLARLDLDRAVGAPAPDAQSPTTPIR